jgi:DNA-binding CsgD family transcriptional regulator
MRLSRRDLERALEIVHVASSADGTEPFPWPVVESLARLVPGQSVAYQEWDLRTRELPTMAVEVPVAPRPPDVAEARRQFCRTYPLSILRLNGVTRPWAISDFISLRRLHRLDYYEYVLRPSGVEHQMRLWLPSSPTVSRVFCFNRQSADRDFGERERGLLEVLRPFLAATRERFELRRAGPSVTVDSLTEREAEILTWVARGKTNQEIAVLLVVSAHTVRKHLENVYAKLNVHTRTAAVARVTAPLELGA